ncbi:MAG: class I SAM-dependent RNA methyltransferase [Myxococcales bacterium]|nr:class I SAM-dependent RNA methyltransferase [Myxococcales bacterium]
MPVRVRIRDLSHGGDGVGEQEDGLTWFVPGALPGEVVEVEPLHRKARWARGALLRVLKPGPDRVEPPCSLADRCGGCDWQHVRAEAQAEHKRAIVAGQLRALVADESQVRLARTKGSGLGYRRRARMHFERRGDGLALGFFASRSREVVDVPRCPVLRPELEHALSRVRELAPLLPERGEVMALSDGRQAALALPGVRPDDDVRDAAAALLDEQLVGVLLRGGRRSATVGRPTLALDGGDGLVPMLANPFVFTQANAAVNRALVRHVMIAAKAEGQRVLELYAGAGNLSRALARTARRVWTLDDDQEATRLLQELAQTERLPIKARRGSAPNLLQKLAAGLREEPDDDKKRYDVVVVDPPRRGLGEAMAADLAEVATRRVVYVSCDPATLARDLKVLVGKGLRLVDVTVFDMMPMTAEVEVVATLARPGGGA